MKVNLGPGVELDVLNADELHHTLREVLSGYARKPQTDRHPSFLKLDANGNTNVGSTSGVAVPTFKIPASLRFGLHRMTIKADGYTFGSPYTSSTGYLEIQRATETVDGVSLASVGLPAVFTAGTADAPLYTNGQTVDLLVIGGPASTALTIQIQGTLEPLINE